MTQFVVALRYKQEGRGFGIFHWRNLSDHTMALWSTQPLTRNDYCTRNISWGRR